MMPCCARCAGLFDRLSNLRKLRRHIAKPKGSWRRRQNLLALVPLALGLLMTTAQAQLIVIDNSRVIYPPRPPIPAPRPVAIPSSYKIRSVDVQTSIKDQA